MNAAEHAAALERIAVLCAVDPALGTPEGEELDALVTEVMDYEAKHFPFPQEAPPSAGRVRAVEFAIRFAMRLTATRVLNVMAQLEAFYTLPEAVLWFELPQATLEGKRPIDLIASGHGADMERVAAVLDRLRDGAHL
jgi:antitoxin Xre/MbcA/ParS-like protein